MNGKINAIKFYFEKVQHQPQMFFDIPRPKKPSTLPKMLSKTEIRKLFKQVENKKHLLILKLCYGMGLRVSEIVNIKIFNIDSEYAVPEGLIFSLMFLPILSLSSFLCYRRYKRHYIEHLIASIYLFSTFGIIVLIVQHLATYLFNLESNDDRWFLLLIGATTLWNAMVFTSPNNWFKIALNTVAEFLIITAIIALLLLGLYALGIANLE